LTSPSQPHRRLRPDTTSAMSEGHVSSVAGPSHLRSLHSCCAQCADVESRWSITLITMPRSHRSFVLLRSSRGETVRGGSPRSHLMNAVPRLRFPCQGSVVHVGRSGRPRRAERTNVDPLHRMRETDAHTHQPEQHIAAPAIEPDGSHPIGTFLTAKRACAGRDRTARLVLLAAGGRMENTITGTVSVVARGGA